MTTAAEHMHDGMHPSIAVRILRSTMVPPSFIFSAITEHKVRQAGAAQRNCVRAARQWDTYMVCGIINTCQHTVFSSRNPQSLL